MSNKHYEQRNRRMALLLQKTQMVISQTRRGHINPKLPANLQLQYIGLHWEERNETPATNN